MKYGFLILLLSALFLSCSTTRTIPVTPPPAVTVTPEPVKQDTVPVTPIAPKPAPRPPVNSRTDVFLQELLKSRPQFFQSILDNRDSFRVQIIYTKIDRQKDNTPVFTPYYFNVSDESYFYPASTVKLPVALLALQKLNELKVFGLNSRSSMITENGYGRQTQVFNDPASIDGRPTISQYVKKIFLVSDNDAFNRLYEFLGQQFINERISSMGYQHVDILHRLDIPLTEDENRHTNPVRFFSETGAVVYTQPMQVSSLVYPKRTDSAGYAYISNGSTVNQAMSFANKNRVGLDALNSMLKSILFPGSVPPRQKFNLADDDRQLVLRAMSQFPRESVFPHYDSTIYYDAYLKFLLLGAKKDTVPGNIRIFNKSGIAYGFLTDVAYIIDTEKNIEFMLSATIYCNSDGVINDGRYDYETVGLPFMQELGRLIYDYESKRERLVKPDLSGFKF